MEARLGLPEFVNITRVNGRVFFELPKGVAFDVARYPDVAVDITAYFATYVLGDLAMSHIEDAREAVRFLREWARKRGVRIDSVLGRAEDLVNEYEAAREAGDDDAAEEVRVRLSELAEALRRIVADTVGDREVEALVSTEQYRPVWCGRVEERRLRVSDIMSIIDGCIEEAFNPDGPDWVMCIHETCWPDN